MHSFVRLATLSVAGLAAVIGAAGGNAHADTTPQALPFAQAWTDPGLITTDNDWSGVPGVIGYRGDGLVSATGADPRTIVADGSGTPVSVLADETNPNTLSTGGVAELALADPAVALNGSGTADAPHLVIHLDTTGVASIRVRYDVRDLDGSVDDAIQPVALQYRVVGTHADFIDVPEAFVADATTGPELATQVTSVDVAIPGAGDAAHVELRFITANAVGNDEWVGIDNIRISDASRLEATATATPAQAAPGETVQVTVAVTPALTPASTGITVTCDLGQIGGADDQALLDDGASGDGAAGDGVFGVVATIEAGTPAGPVDVPCTASDAEARTAAATAALEILAVCGDGVAEGAEACDDGDTDDGDGCSATCTLEPGWDCAGTAPTVCTDVDECAAMTDDCADVGGVCTDIDGGFTCACDDGYDGDGTACAPTCGDGAVVIGEPCDDGGTETGDGCAADCTVESGFECAGEPSDCAPACGDGLVVGGEECDDGGLEPGDGCDDACVVEDGWACTGVPSTCSETSRCGDGVIDAGEDCDDGNEDSDDGCDATCVVEDGWLCTGAPTTCARDADGDLIVDPDDNCPDVANPSQQDDDDDGTGNACDPDGPGGDDGGDGGCCSAATSPGQLGGTAALALLTLLAVGRRRRGRAAR